MGCKEFVAFSMNVFNERFQYPTYVNAILTDVAKTSKKIGQRYSSAPSPKKIGPFIPQLEHAGILGRVGEKNLTRSYYIPKEQLLMGFKFNVRKPVTSGLRAR
jgi:hypothetical protein